MTQRRREGERGDVPRRPSTDEIDTSVLRLSPEQRRERGIPDDAVRAAFYAAVIDGDREQKDLSGATLPGLSLSYAVVGGDDNHPIDLRGATITGHLDVDHADVQVPLPRRSTSRTTRTTTRRRPRRRAGAAAARRRRSDRDPLRRDEVRPRLGREPRRHRRRVDAGDPVPGGRRPLAGRRRRRPYPRRGDVRRRSHRRRGVLRGAFSARGAEFHGTSNRLEDNTSFAGARFDDDADFTQAGFGYVRFEDDADFPGATFVDATFADDADFGDATFSSGDFERTRFAASRTSAT